MRRIEVEHNGEIYTAKRLSEMAKRGEKWCRRKLNMVLDGEMSMAELLKIAESNKVHNHSRYKNLAFVYTKKDAKGRPRKITVTPELLIEKLGLSRQAAVKRILRAREGVINAEKLMSRPRAAKYRVGPLTDPLPPERARLRDDLKAVGEGSLSYNEIMRRDNQKYYQREEL